MKRPTLEFFSLLLIRKYKISLQKRFIALDYLFSIQQLRCGFLAISLYQYSFLIFTFFNSTFLFLAFLDSDFIFIFFHFILLHSFNVEICHIVLNRFQVSVFYSFRIKLTFVCSKNHIFFECLLFCLVFFFLFFFGISRPINFCIFYLLIFLI